MRSRRLRVLRGLAGGAAPPETVLVMLAGQSNQVGIGTATDGSDLPAYLADTEDPYANDEILIWKGSAQGGPDWFTLRNSKNNNGAGDATASNWASEAQLSFELWEDASYTKPIYLSKNAVSSTSIADWIGTNMPGAVTTHFQPALDEVLGVDAAARVWFVWHQGHADAETNLDYATDLVELIDGAEGGYEGLRSDLGLTAQELQVIVVRGDDTWAHVDAWENGAFQIRQAKGCQLMSNVWLIDNPSTGDGTHLSPEGYVAVGSAEYDVITGTYGFASAVAGATQTVSIPSDTANTTVIVTLSATSMGTPEGRWELTGTGSEHFRVEPFTGDVEVFDQASLEEGTYNLTATLHNGQTPSSKSLDVTITAAAGAPDPVVLIDPNDSGNYTLTGQGYSAINNQITTSETWVQTTDARRPPQGTLANSKEVFDMAANGVMTGPNSDTWFTAGVDTDCTVAFWCHPDTGVAGAAAIFGLGKSTNNITWGVRYDYANQRFVLLYTLDSNNAVTVSNEAGTTPSPIDNDYVIVIEKTATTVTVYKNGTSIITVSSNVSTEVFQGTDGSTGGTPFGGVGAASPAYQGLLGPLYIYDTLLTTGQREDLEATLTAWAS